MSRAFVWYVPTMKTSSVILLAVLVASCSSAPTLPPPGTGGSGGLVTGAGGSAGHGGMPSASSSVAVSSSSGGAASSSASSSTAASSAASSATSSSSSAASSSSGGPPDGTPTNCDKKTVDDSICQHDYPDQGHAYLCFNGAPDAPSGCVHDTSTFLTVLWCCSEGCVPKTAAQACDGVHCAYNPDGCGGYVDCQGYKCSTEQTGYCLGGGSCGTCTSYPTSVCPIDKPTGYYCGSIPTGCVMYAQGGTGYYVCCPS